MTRLAQSQRVLVLGSTGKLGRILRARWADRTDVSWQGRRDVDSADVVWSPGKPWQGPDRVDLIVALWGVVPGKDAPDLGENADLAIAAMELGRMLGADRVLHCSSAAVYPQAPGPQAEDRADPRNPYGIAKFRMEQAIADWCATHPDGPAACAMRIGNVAGADSAFAAIARGGAVTMDRFAGGQGPQRSYIGHDALARVIDALLTCPRSALPVVVNVVQTGAVDMADLVRAAGRDLIWKDAPQGADAAVLLDNTRLKMLVDPGTATPLALVADAMTWWETTE